jgi:hypothetical protein
MLLPVTHELWNYYSMLLLIEHYHSHSSDELKLDIVLL